MIMPGTAATAKPWVSKPHSGHGRSSTQVQSLVSGVIVMPACYPCIGFDPWDPEILPFLLEVPEAELADLRRRLRQTRWPEPEPVSDWSQGVPLAYLRDLCEYWADGYDWRATEARLNALPLFQTAIDGIRIVFAHVRSPRPDALPLILTHGWPGSVVEFGKVIGPLPIRRARRRRGDAFHVVCPCLPGYGFSGKPDGTGWGVERIARAWAELMARLGYSRYGTAGQRLGHQHQHPARPAGPGARGRHPPGPPLAGPDPATSW